MVALSTAVASPGDGLIGEILDRCEGMTDAMIFRTGPEHGDQLGIGIIEHPVGYSPLEQLELPLVAVHQHGSKQWFEAFQCPGSDPSHSERT